MFNQINTPSNTETHASKIQRPCQITEIKIANIEFENLFSNLSLTYFKTVADPFSEHHSSFDD